MMFLDVLGNIGGIYSFFLPFVGFFIQSFAEHMFIIKFVKMAFIIREEELDN